jgi:hypothetical protein
MPSWPALTIRPLPLLDLRHMQVLTDDTAMLQHATHATPNLHHGYCTDDNARSLIAGTLYLHLAKARHEFDHPENPSRDKLVVMIQRYLAFLAYAFNEQTGRFRNFMGYDRTWLEEVGSEDSHARALWGLAAARRFAPNDDVRDHAEMLFHKALPAAGELRFIRSWAYSLLALHENLACEDESGQAGRLRDVLADRLYGAWAAHAQEDWPWWEDELTWGNAKLPHAMLLAGEAMGEADMTAAALKALRWLVDVQRRQDGTLSVIGNGWYVRNGDRSRFDQQPIEAQGLLQACLAAARVTGDAAWTEAAEASFEWFRGRNDVGVSLYNEETGGGQDGLHPDGPDPNQGAESTLAYVLSALEVHLYEQQRRHESNGQPVVGAEGPA